MTRTRCPRHVLVAVISTTYSVRVKTAKPHTPAESSSLATHFRQGSTKCRKVSDADHCPQEERDGEMRSQLMMHDTAGMTLGT